MKDQVQLEQYKQAHAERARCTHQQWQMIGVGNPLVAGVLVAAFASPSLTTSVVLSSFSIPICLFLFIAYRKEVYFENLASENIEAIEAESGVKHMQYDTFPQKPGATHYVTHHPKRWRVESLSVHTLMTVLLLLYNVVASAAFVHFAGRILSLYASVGIALGAYPSLYGLLLLLNRGERIEQSFRAGKTHSHDIEALAPADRI
jgi:Na+/melibiose symporter-like transporter